MEQALEQLLLAFTKADEERGPGRLEEVEWEDLNLALDMAREALPGRYLEIVRELKAQDEEDAEDQTPAPAPSIEAAGPQTDNVHPIMGAILAAFKST